MLNFYCLLYLNNSRVTILRDAGFTCIAIIDEGVTGLNTRHYRVFLATNVQHFDDWDHDVTLGVISDLLDGPMYVYDGAIEDATQPGTFLVKLEKQ